MVQLRHMHKAYTVSPVTSSISPTDFSYGVNPALDLFVSLNFCNITIHHKVLQTVPGIKNHSVTFVSQYFTVRDLLLYQKEFSLL